MPNSVATYLSRLTPDPWRIDVGFSSDIEEAHRILFKPNTTEDEILHTINNWIFHNQPCLFGRIAAQRELISYCILTAEDLNKSDEEISRKIQASRRNWSREAQYGQKSGFVIVALAEPLALALPNSDLKELAIKLCSLYLLTEINLDKVHLDTLDLELPFPSRPLFRWNVGVNYFASQGDQRWWHDHRFPGGIAFSMNSVGHMVKSGQLASEMIKLEERLRAGGDEWIERPLNSLERALIIAMKTIDNAHETMSGKATSLLPQKERPHLQCPVTLPPDLVGKDFCEYIGYYHTDFTIPSVYFDPNPHRPEGLAPYTLDFTYLFHNDIENLDFLTTGEGRQVREENGTDQELQEYRRQKLLKAQGKEISKSEPD